MKKYIIILLTAVMCCMNVSANIAADSEIIITENNRGYITENDGLSDPINAFFEADGVFGRKKGDTSVKIQTAGGKYPCTGTGKYGNAQAYFPFLNAQIDSTVMTPGETLELSFYYAYTNRESMLHFTPFLYKDTAKNTFAFDIAVNADGIKFSGQEIASFKTAQEFYKWYRFDMVIKTSENGDSSEMVIYIDGEAAAEKSIAMVYGISKERIGYRHGAAFAEENDLPNSGLYIDDIDAKIHKDFEYMPIVGDTVYTDRFGYETEEESDYTTITDEQGRTLYFNREKMTFYSDFNGEKEYDGRPFSGWDETIGGKLVEALGGRSEKDFSFYCDNEAYLKINSGGGFAEFAVMPYESSKIEGTVLGNEILIENSTLYINGEEIQKIKNNCWNTVSCEGSGGIELRITGKAAIDDAAVYENRADRTGISLETLNGAETDGKTIILERPVSAEEFKTFINTDAQTAILYDDEKCMQRNKSKLFADKGMTLSLIKNGGIFDYYTIDTKTQGSRISIESDNKSVRQGQCVNISAEGEPGESVLWIVYVNGKNIAQFNVLPFTAENAAVTESGTNSIMAVAYDENGKLTAVSDCIEIIADPNDPPEIYFEENTDEMIKNLKTTVNAYDSDGVAKVKAVLDGIILEEKSEPPYTFELGAVSVGRHTLEISAYDLFGMKSTIKREFTKTVQNDEIFAEVDFENISSVSELEESMLIHCSDSGAELSIQNDGISDYGEITLKSTGGNPWVGLDIFKSGKIRIEGDVILKGMTGGFDINTTTGVKGTTEGRSGTGNFYFKNGTLGLYNGSELKTVSYSSGRHSFIYELNMYTKKYSFAWDGETLAEDYRFRIINEDHNEMREIRFGFSGSIGISHGIDNLKASVINEAPYVDSLMFSDGQTESSEADCKTNRIAVYMSAAINAADLTKDNIKLMCGDEEIEIKEIKPDKNGALFEICLEQPLAGSSEYKLIISEDVRSASGETTDGGSLYIFKTKTDNFGVENIVFKENGIEISKISGGSLSIEAELENTSEINQTAVIIVAVRDSGKLKKMISRTLNAAPGKEDVFIGGINTAELKNPSVTVYITDGWQTRKAIKESVKLN